MVRTASFLKGLCLLVCLASLAGAAGAADFFFKDGDVIAVMGDSITEQHLYSNYLEMWTRCRFPAWKLEFHNVGIGGDRSPGGNSRFKRDVLTFKATAMTVDFGMNDGGYTKFDPQTFKDLHRWPQGHRRPGQGGRRPRGLADAQPGRESARPGRPSRATTKRWRSIRTGVKQVAAANNAVFVDQFHPFIAVQDKARAENPANRIGGGDAVHPGPPGQAVMAWAILKGLGLPALGLGGGDRRGGGQGRQVRQLQG